MSSLKGGIFWMRFECRTLSSLRVSILAKVRSTFRPTFIVTTSNCDCVCFCSRYFLFHSFSGFKYLPAPRVPFDCFALFTDRRPQPKTTYVFGHPDIGDFSIDPYSAPRNISETILSVFIPPFSFLVFLLCFENMFTFATISLIYKHDGF